MPWARERGVGVSRPCRGRPATAPRASPPEHRSPPGADPPVHGVARRAQPECAVPRQVPPSLSPLPRCPQANAGWVLGHCLLEGVGVRELLLPPRAEPRAMSLGTLGQATGPCPHAGIAASREGAGGMRGHRPPPTAAGRAERGFLSFLVVNFGAASVATQPPGAGTAADQGGRGDSPARLDTSQPAPMGRGSWGCPRGQDCPVPHGVVPLVPPPLPKLPRGRGAEPPAPRPRR